MRTIVISILGVALLAFGVSALAVQRTVPPGSYLRTPVSSVEQLAAEIGKDRVVQKQFAAHFGVPPSHLQGYIRDNVVIRQVSSNTPKSVYVIRRNGKMVAQRTTLKKGTPIFALKDTGEPLLVLKCGNPVVKKLPVREKVLARSPETFQLLRPTEAMLPPPAPPAPPVAETPALPPAVAGVAVSVPPPIAAMPVAAVGGKGVGILPLTALVAVHHGHSNKPPVPPPPIPEPGGAAAVAATALLPAAGWGIRKLRCRQDVAEKA